MYRIFNLIKEVGIQVYYVVYDFVIFIFQLVRKNGFYKYFIIRYIKKCLRNIEIGNIILDFIFN